MAKEKDPLILLKDDELYYGDYGSQWLSNSDIKVLLDDPVAWGQPKGFQLPLEQGKVFHWHILEPEKAEEVTYATYGSRNAKGYKEEIELLDVDGVLLEKEVEDAKGWGDTILKNDHFRSIIEHPNADLEVPGVKKIMGYPFKGKMDIKLPSIGYDLKSTGDLTQFKWNAKKYGYDSQAYIYEQIFGVPLVFLVVCKKTGQLAKFYCSPDFVLGGKEKVIRGIEQYEKFYGENPTEDLEQYFLEGKL